MMNKKNSSKYMLSGRYVVLILVVPIPFIFIGLINNVIVKMLFGLITASVIISAVVIFLINIRSITILIGVILLTPFLAFSSISFLNIDSAIKLIIQEKGEIAEKPGKTTIMGRDNYGRDILFTLLESSKNTYIISIISTSFAFIIGFTLGIIKSKAIFLFRDVADILLQTIITLPQLLLLLIIFAVYHTLITGGGDFIQYKRISLLLVGLAIGITLMPSLASLLEIKILDYESREFIRILRLSGESKLKIVLYNILYKNCRGDVIIQLAVIFAASILAEASLNFLFRIGFGDLGASGYLSWGSLLAEGRSSLMFNENYWIPAGPGGIIIATLVGIRIVNDYLVIKERID